MMKRLVTFIIALLPLITYAQKGSIFVNTQESWPPGKYVPVRVQIINPGTDGFARFYQDLPQGFKVQEANSAGADFYWDNNQVNFVWVKIPRADTLLISYLAMADQSLSGSFRLAGKLDYVIGGTERESIESGTLLIRLDRNADIEESIDIPVAKTTVKDEDTDQIDDEKDISEEVDFRVQVAISSDQLTKEELESRLNCELTESITILKTGNVYKYQSGSFKKYAQSQSYLDRLKNSGVKDAFIVAYRGNEQITVELARTITE